MYVPLSLLRRHVRESNLIEQIRQRSGVALVSSHLNAAVQVSRRYRHELLNPLEIHAWLSHRTSMEWFGGHMRTCDVYVGKWDMPRWEEVPNLLGQWWSLVKSKDEEMRHAPKKERERMARLLHDLLLCVHPFRDGNGRTSRLFLNQLRLRWGLPWLIIEYRKRGIYYRRIEHTQETIFRPSYPHVFPKDRINLEP